VGIATGKGVGLYVGVSVGESVGDEDGMIRGIVGDDIVGDDIVGDDTGVDGDEVRGNKYAFPFKLSIVPTPGAPTTTVFEFNATLVPKPVFVFGDIYVMETKLLLEHVTELAEEQPVKRYAEVLDVELDPTTTFVPLIATAWV